MDRFNGKDKERRESLYIGVYSPFYTITRPLLGFSIVPGVIYLLGLNSVSLSLALSRLISVAGNKGFIYVISPARSKKKFRNSPSPSSSFAIHYTCARRSSQSFN